MRKENKIYCNSCGKRIVDTIGREMEEYIHIEKIWGYPSEKDGECHSFDLCEQRVRKKECLMFVCLDAAV